MLAESDDFIHWNKLGPAQVPAVFEYPSADYRQFSNYLECGSPWFIEEDGTFYMFNTSDTGPKGNFAPMPYYATLSFGPSLAGPWQKETLLPGRGKHIAIPVRPGTYYSDTACAGSVMENPAWQGPEDRENRRYMMFFSAASCHGKPGDYRSLGRGVGIARSDCLTAADDYDKLEGNFWEPDPAPIIPLEDDVENATLFHDADPEEYGTSLSTILIQATPTRTPSGSTGRRIQTAGTPTIKRKCSPQRAAAGPMGRLVCRRFFG